MNPEYMAGELDPVDSDALDRLQKLDEFSARKVIQKVFPDLKTFMQEQWNQAQESASEDAFFRSRKSWAVDPTIEKIQSGGLAHGKGTEISNAIDEVLAEKQ